MKIKLNYYQMDKVVVESLTSRLKVLLNPNNDVDVTSDNKASDISAFFTTLRYYTTEDEFNEIIEGLNK